MGYDMFNSEIFLFKGFKSTVVNRAMPFFHGVSLKITLTMSLLLTKTVILFYSFSMFIPYMSLVCDSPQVLKHSLCYVNFIKCNATLNISQCILTLLISKLNFPRDDEIKYC